MNQFKNILFDLDGTLIEPFVGITKSIQYALEKLNVPIPQETELAVHIGTPLRHIFVELLATDEPKQIERAVTFYRERYTTIGLWENEVYPGVKEMLHALFSSSHKLYIATGKPRIFAEKIIDSLSFSQYFCQIFGSELDGKYDNKADLIEHILISENLLPAETIIVGDRHHDIVAGKTNKITAIGVTYGYGSAEELIAAGANSLCHSPSDLSDCIVNLGRLGDEN